jgi:hypothetical protein
VAQFETGWCRSGAPSATLRAGLAANCSTRGRASYGLILKLSHYRLILFVVLVVVSLFDVMAEPLYEAVDPATLQPIYDQRGQSQPTMTESNLRTHEQAYKSETLEATINPRSELEFMTTIDQGEVLLYAWQTSKPLYYDFHGHQPEGNPDVWTRYADGTADRDQGSLVTPYTGEHGWYWVNEGNQPVTVKLTVTGYYKTVFKIDLSAGGQ